MSYPNRLLTPDTPTGDRLREMWTASLDGATFEEWLNNKLGGMLEEERACRPRDEYAWLDQHIPPGEVRFVDPNDGRVLAKIVNLELDT